MTWEGSEIVILEQVRIEVSFKPDNVYVHRAAAKIIVSKSRAARGSVCNVLILIMASLSEAVCPLPLIVVYVLADVNPQLDL